MGHVPTGYEIGRDDRGLTNRERQALGLLVQGREGWQIAEELGVTRQRVHALIRILEKKGVLVRGEDGLTVTLTNEGKKEVESDQ